MMRKLADFSLSGMLCIVYSVIMLIGICLWYFVLPYNGSIENYSVMILDDNWVIINIILWLGTGIGIFIFFSLLYSVKQKIKKIGKAGLVLIIIAFLIQFSLYSWEAFIFPELIKINQIKDAISNGIVISSNSINMLFGCFSLFYISGFLLFGISSIKNKVFPLYSILLIITGSAIYSFSFVFGGYVGLLSFSLYLAGIFWIGIYLMYNRETQLSSHNF
jgi:hypothetical protein